MDKLRYLYISNTFDIAIMSCCSLFRFYGIKREVCVFALTIKLETMSEGTLGISPLEPLARISGGGIDKLKLVYI